MGELQLWGGHECTVNRVGEAFFDQTVRSGHHGRISDLDLFADLGLRTLRYPLLWERLAPQDSALIDWRWSDERMGRMRELGLRPVVGLLHHGSGPRYTNLLDDGLADAFAGFASAVARRYPDIRDWTPINEPLTTARFSALYGLWYPHARDERAFWAALLNEIEATRVAMAAIREVRPDARLVQTEDLGRTYATRGAAHQASFDNERRWASWDLLFGRITPGHPFWDRLASFGFEERLKSLADDPCPPDVVGVNHYVTSDRFLDHDAADYPSQFRGGNYFTEFADVPATRAVVPAPAGLEGALEEAWRRYGATLAVTEVHVGCTRDEQIRWLLEAWDAAHALRERGADIEAVTAWALLGSYDWSCLLTRQDGCYESGAFDVSGGAQPRLTALGETVRQLATGSRSLHPVAQGPGWWHRDIRLLQKPFFRSVETPEPRARWRCAGAPAPAPLLITGATGTLGKALARTCEWRAIDYVLTDRAALSLDDPRSIEAALDRYRPWAVINAAGWVRVDDAESNEPPCMEANATGAARLAIAAANRELPFVGFSSDLVFDGAATSPYHEGCATAPLNAYGRSKAAAERNVLALPGNNLMIRTSAFFSPFDPHNFAIHVARTLARGGSFEAADDLVVSPTYVPDLTDAVLDLLIDGETGLWHLANPSAVSWAQFARMVATAMGLDEDLVHAVPSAQFGWAARRPAYVPLISRRGALMQPLDRALQRFAGMLRASAFEGESEGAPVAEVRSPQAAG
jgi:dTDP-4-dehydrorhamnose reductase